MNNGPDAQKRKNPAMLTKDQMKQRVCETIAAHRDRLVALGEDILRHPELGYREVRTGALVQDVFQSLGLPVQTGLGITGCRADLNGQPGGPRLAILGELDGIVVPGHPFADPATGASHACGHHAQICALAGAAIALATSGVMPELTGSIAFLAVPSEESQQLEYYQKLLAEQRIHFCGGKSQLIYEGVFNDIDLAMMIHAGPACFAPASFNGFVMKCITFHGHAAHAGLQPELGINALSMLRMAINLWDAQRDTLRDDDAVRLHGVITDGGTAVNVVPATAKMELQVRAKTPDAVHRAADLVDRCVQAAALAFGGAADIDNILGYMPLRGYPELDRIHGDNLRRLAPQEPFPNTGHRGSSTDMGDVSMIMPILHAYCDGFAGKAHGADFLVTDPEKAYVRPAQILAMNAIDLLADGAAAGQAIAALQPPMTREHYLAAMHRLTGRKQFDFRTADPAQANGPAEKRFGNPR